MRPLALLLLAVLVGCASPESSEPAGDLEALARGIHERVIAADTHADIDVDDFTEERNYTMDLPTQVNLPKMEAGGLDVVWFIVYTDQKELTDEGYAEAYANAISKFEAIHWLADEKASDRIEMAYTSDDVRRIIESGKKVAMIGIENAYPVGLDLDNIRDFAERGGRYMSLSHNDHSQFSDSNTGEEDGYLHNGLSEIGREAVAEMNKWGIMVDISHPSQDAIRQMIELSAAPVVASHSSARALSDHPRNLTDELLMLVKENGGVVQTVALARYVNVEKHGRWEAVRRAAADSVAASMGLEIIPWSELRGMPDDEIDAYRERMAGVTAAVDAMSDALTAKAPRVNVADFVDHIDYMVELIGLDHVGISSDFDGGGGIEGWDDASETFNVTLELVRRGYTEEQIAQLWSGNLLRVLDDVQAVAAELQAGS